MSTLTQPTQIACIAGTLAFLWITPSHSESFDSATRQQYLAQVQQSVSAFDLYRRVFAKLSDYCQQPLSMTDADIASFTTLMKDKVGISYLQFIEATQLLEQQQRDANILFTEWTKAAPDCKDVSFRIQYRSAELEVKNAIKTIEQLPGHGLLKQ